jgi:hypothetical protein
MKRMVIAGGTGFLGSILLQRFRDEYEVVVLTRGASHKKDKLSYVNWDGVSSGPWTSQIEGAEVVINLNGKSVDCRYTPKNKALIYSTRLESTAALGRAIQQAKVPPRLWINASSATIYRHSMDKEMDEYTGDIGTGFSVDVCQKWEGTFNALNLPSTRKVLLRTGIVLGKNGGPLKPLKRLAQFGFGGKHGPGDQYFSWLHESDFAEIVSFLIQNDTCTGAYNVTAPVPMQNREVMKALRKAMGIQFGLPISTGLLEFGAALIGTETELVLKSRRVVPKRLLEDGYEFNFENIQGALVNLVRP